jgi:ABC-type branched-subunit amino acid transport system ATPase component
MSLAPGHLVDTRPAAPEIVIDVHGLTKSFGGRQVVRDLSMQVKRGTIFGFLGPNGSGKTTTHPHAVRAVDTRSGRRLLPWFRHPHRGGEDQKSRRLHDATFQPLRRSFGAKIWNSSGGSMALRGRPRRPKR